MENEKKIENVVGAGFEDMDLDEMANVQGAGDVNPETTPAASAIASPAVSKAVSGIVTVIASGALSAAKC